jgi:hypothetical protein
LTGPDHDLDREERATHVALSVISLPSAKDHGCVAPGVSDSADSSTQGSRIVTAAHVIEETDTTRDGRRWAVFFSDGLPLGVPHTVLRGATRELSVRGFNLVENDIAVIEITSFNNDAARDRFLRLQGLPLYGGGDILVGESGQPLGVSWGFSGAAAIDPAGRVVGVLTSRIFATARRCNWVRSSTPIAPAAEYHDQ